MELQLHLLLHLSPNSELSKLKAEKNLKDEQLKQVRRKKGNWTHLANQTCGLVDMILYPQSNPS